MQDIINYFIQNPTALYVAVGLLSLCIGSFLNVVIYRTPKMMEQEWHQMPNIITPRTTYNRRNKINLKHPTIYMSKM